MTMKMVLRVAVLLLCTLTGVVVAAHGIMEVVAVRAPGHADIVRHLVEGSISIAAGACVVAVAIDRLECLRTHRRSGDFL